jgi:hypothetical protein
LGLFGDHEYSGDDGDIEQQSLSQRTVTGGTHCRLHHRAHPIVAEELVAAGYRDGELAERIAKRVVLKQLYITDLDDLRRS